MGSEMKDQEGDTVRLRPGLEEQSPVGHASGRASFDARGNTVWEWKTESGEYSSDVSTMRVKMLEADLTLEKTAIVAKPDVPATGFNPYNSAVPAVSKPGANAVRPASKSPPPRTFILPPAKPVGFLAKLKAAISGR